MEILTKRPAGMSYADYKMHLKKQGAWLKERVSRGFLVYKSWEAVKSPVENGESGLAVRKFSPFVGSVKQLKSL
ncbi:hypothetical protein PF672P2_00081 [Parabacteroides phage PF672P2]|nr:hypothetical protein PF672P2_00081 [Parabacteroides phage PF672P2]